MWFLHWNSTSTCWEAWVIALCSSDEWNSLCLCSPPFPFQCSGTSCPPLFLSPDLGQCRTQRHICPWRLCLLLLSPTQTPNLFPSPWQDGSISQTTFWFCISILFSCLLIRSLDVLSLIILKHFISSLVFGEGGKKLRIFSWTPLQSIVWVLLLHACISVELKLSPKGVLSMPKLFSYII